LRLPNFLDSWLKDDDEVVSYMLLPLPLRKFLYSLLLEAESTLTETNNPVTSPGIEPAAFPVCNIEPHKTTVPCLLMCLEGVKRIMKYLSVDLGYRQGIQPSTSGM
jgi:hypothetical protein